MKWIQRTALLGKQPYTALVTDDAQARELGRYDHLPDGTFQPGVTRGHAKPRATHMDARRFVLAQVLQKLKDDIGEVGLLWGDLGRPVNHKGTRGRTFSHG